MAVRKSTYSLFVEEDGVLYMRPRWSVFVPKLIIFILVLFFLLVATKMRWIDPPWGELWTAFWVSALFILPMVGIALLVYEIGRYRFGPSGSGRPLARGQPLVKVDKDTLTLANLLLWRIKIPLSTLRALSIQSTFWLATTDGKGGRFRIRFEKIDGEVKTVSVFYAYEANEAVADFLRRKLPPSVQFAVTEAPYFGGGPL